MLHRNSSRTKFGALIFLASFVLASGTIRGRLRNYDHNTKCIHAVGSHNGAAFEIVDCSDSSEDQFIIADGFQSMEGDAGYIQFDASGKCLSLNGFDSDNGVHMLIWDCVGQDNQKWSIVNRDSGGSFQLQLKSTGKCLTAENGGAYLYQWDCVARVDLAPHQSWILDVMDPPDPPITVKAVLRNYQFNTKCMHPVGQYDGAKLEIVDCSKVSSDQIIRATSFQNRAYQADYVQFDVSGKCLSLNGFSSENGVHVLIWDCVGQDNQKWSIINGDSRGFFQLQLKSTGKCLTAESNGAFLHQYECYGTDVAPHQYWLLDPIHDADLIAEDPPPREVTYKGILRNFGYNTKCVHAAGGNNGAELEVVDCSESNADQLLKMGSFLNMEHEANYVQFDASGKCLSLNGFSSDSGVHILIWDCVGKDNQKWRIINGDFGHTFQLQLKSTGKCLTAENGGAYLDQWDCISNINLAPQQAWTIDRVELFKGDVNLFHFFQLENFDSPNNCLRYKGGTTTSYALELVPCDAEDPFQQMMVYTNYADSLGYTGIQFVTSGQCLDVFGESNTNGATVGQYDCVNQANQRWLMEDFQGDGSFRIRTQLDAKCLTFEVTGALDIWDCLGKSSAPHQYWKQRNPNQQSKKKIHLLQNYNYPDKCLHPAGTSKENGGLLELIDCDLIKPEESMNTDEWITYDTTPGYVKFNGKCLSMSGFASDNGVSLIQWDCVGQANQRWKIINGDINTNFQLQSEQSSKCLTAEAGGSYMDQWECFGRDAAPHQSWMIKTIGGGGEQHEDTNETPVNFFATEGALFEVVDHPGKCLSASGTNNGAEITLDDCNMYDSNQLFDDDDLLNYNTNPGLLKLTGTNKCLSLSSNNNVTIQDCDITKLNEIWFVVAGTLFGTFQLKTSQSLKCITAEDGYTDVTDCVVAVSDSRGKRDLSARTRLRLSYKMSQPAGNQQFLIKSAYYPGYCLSKVGASKWTGSAVGINDCNKTDETQKWHFEQVGPEFQNVFYVRNGGKCLCSKELPTGYVIDYLNDCADRDEFKFSFRKAGKGNSFYQLRSVKTGLCMQVKWYNQKFDDGTYDVDYIEQKQCGLVGLSNWMSIPITDQSIDGNCGSKYGGKFCTGRFANNCCSRYGYCGTSTAHCSRGECDPIHGPCFNYFTDTLGLDQKCGPWVATLPGRDGRCAGNWGGSGYCCSKYGLCSRTGSQDCAALNCDSEYGSCPKPDKDNNPDRCGPFWGEKKCTGAFADYCCSKEPNKYAGTCGTRHEHCGESFCDKAYGGMCLGGKSCGWVGSSKKRCSVAGECCSIHGKCGTTEEFCGVDCDVKLSCLRCNGGSTSTAGGILLDPIGTVCTTSECGKDNVPCTIREWCCPGYSCVDDPAKSKPGFSAKKCVKN